VTVYLTVRLLERVKILKLLVTGASGLLGRVVMKRLKEISGFSVTGTALSRAKPPLVRLDLTDYGEVADFVRADKPEIIIHAAAERRPDISLRDPHRTRELNVIATRHLAEVAEEIGARILFMSTDYVFDGTAPPYAPDSETNPLNLYGKSKLDGERTILSLASHACVLRVPILYGEVEYLEETPITLIAKSLKKDVPQKIDNWAIRYPTHVDDVALAIRRIVKHWVEDPKLGGIYHWSAAEAYTKYDMARLMAPIIGADEDKILADDTPPPGAPRPKDSHLDTSRLESLGMRNKSFFRKSIPLILNPFLPLG